MLSKFCSETDTVRDETMKIIPKIVEGPWVAKHALGSKPALLGRAVTSEYHSGEGWFEMDIDVSSSSAASGVLRIMKSCSKALVCNLAYVLEGKNEEELPERLLGTMAFVHFDLGSGQVYHPDRERGGALSPCGALTQARPHASHALVDPAQFTILSSSMIKTLVSTKGIDRLTQET